MGEKSMGSKTLFSLFLGLILVLSALAVIPVAPAAAGTTGTITVSSTQFYGANMNVGGNGDSDNTADAGEALLQVTINDPDLTAAAATMPKVEASGQTLTLYQAVGGSWVCFISDNSSGLIPVNPSPQDTNVQGLEPDIDNDNDGIADALEDHDNDGIINAWEDTDGDGVVALYDAAGEAAALGNTYNYSKVITRLNLNAGDTVTIKYYDTDPVTTVSTEVTYKASDATISLDRTEYPINGIVRVTVTDADLNFDPTTADTIRAANAVDDTNVGGIDWSSTTDTTDNEVYGTAFKETGGTTGVFKTYFDMSNANFTEALLDVITVKYNDDGTNRTAYATVKSYTGSISLDKSEYSISDTGKVTVVDPDLNTDSSSKQSFTGGAGGTSPVSVKSSKDDTGGRLVKITETGENTGIFEGSFGFSFTAGANGNKPTVFVGTSGPQDITVTYNDASSSTGTAVSVSATSSFVTHTGTVELDKTTYGPNMVATVTVTDPDLNTSSSSQDRYDNDPNGDGNDADAIVQVTSATAGDSAGITLLETGVDTGVFEGNFKFSTTAGTVADIPTLKVSSGGDTITVTYTDAFDAAGNTNQAVTVKATYSTSTGSVELDKASYAPTQMVKVIVTDPDLNLSSFVQEFVNLDYTRAASLEGSLLYEEDVTANNTWETNEPVFWDVNGNGAYNAGTDIVVYDPNGTLNNAPAPENNGDIDFVDLDNDGVWDATEPVFNDADGDDYLDAGETVIVNPLTTWLLWVANAAGAEGTFIKTDYTSAPVFIYSSSWAAGWPTTTSGLFSLKETDVDTGIFKGTTAATLAGLPGSTVKVGDTLYVRYIDAYNSTGASQTLTNAATISTNTGIIELDKDTVKVGEKLKITVTDPDENRDPNTQETGAGSNVNVTFKSGLGDKETIVLNETGKDTGVFEKKITITKAAAATQNNGTYEVKKGDTITIQYTDLWGAGGSQNVKVTETASVYTTDGSVSFDKDTYSPKGKAKITINDPDMNEDSLAVDNIPGNRIKIYSTTDPTGIGGYAGTPFAGAAETGIDTGVFTVTITLSDTQNSDEANKILRVSSGDSIVARYTEESDASGTSDVLRQAVATASYTTATLTFDKDTYSMDDTATVTLTEPDKNENSAVKETVTVTVYSSSDPAGITVALRETDVNTGVFEGTLSFTSGASSGSLLKAAEGDTITTSYTDTTPADYPDVTQKKVTATATIGVTVPALPITAGAPSLTDPTTGEAVTPTAGESVMVSTELENTASVDQDMLYIVQIKDAAGKVVYMSYISGTVPANRAFTFGIQWTPDSAGEYTVEVFSWKSWTEPTPLSESVSQSVTVSE